MTFFLLIVQGKTIPDTDDGTTFATFHSSKREKARTD